MYVWRNSVERATVVAVGNQYVLHIAWVWVCSLWYPWYAHQPYCHLWLVLLDYIFPHYFINGTYFGREKKLLNTKCVFWFFLHILSEIFLILKRTDRHMIITVQRSTREAPVILVRSKRNFELSDRFKKNTQMSNFMKIHPVWAELLVDRRTDRHDEANSPILQLWERA